ncbi:MAG: helix-turn-helix transcriptional regulator [Roseburia sp.]|nr:helix-turn-helix transcriptional regulator [Roseburia sp.]
MENNDLFFQNLSTDDYSGIAARVVYLRTEILHMSQSQFASLLKISQTYLSMVENGKRQISGPIIQRIITTLSVNFEWLVYGVGNDDEIFLSNTITKEYLKSSSKSSSLSALQAAYSLNASEMDYISWYLSLSREERKQYVNAMKTISSMTKLTIRQDHP